MANKTTELAVEAKCVSEILSGKVLARVIRHRSTEVLLEFTDGTRFFVDLAGDVLELSITGGN